MLVPLFLVFFLFLLHWADSSWAHCITLSIFDEAGDVIYVDHGELIFEMLKVSTDVGYFPLGQEPVPYPYTSGGSSRAVTECLHA
jgi:hypothetical protein